MTAGTRANVVRIGPAGWSYKDWNGTVYPTSVRGFDPLEFLARYFDTIEINSPFYGIPPPTHARSWVRRIASNPHFRFTTKLFEGFTHESAPVSDTEVTQFKNYLDVLQENGRLGALLLQFPWSFRRTDESIRHLEHLFELFEGYPRVLEVRHSTFETIAFRQFLQSRNVGFVNIDQPLFDGSVSPSSLVTSEVAYVRFHGRNYEKWFADGESWERYDYLYSERELEPWVDRVRHLDTARETFVITNNHFRGQAVVNALEIKRMLGQRIDVPPQLSTVYRERVEKLEQDAHS